MYDVGAWSHMDFQISFSLDSEFRSSREIEKKVGTDRLDRYIGSTKKYLPKS